MLKKIQDCLLRLRTTKPIILNVTNYVTMDLIANSLLAIGAAPIMSEASEELEELLAISHSLNLNIGTLNESFLIIAHTAIQAATSQKKPIILDPVGSGATHLRTKTAREFLPHAAIVRGNSSELMSLYDPEIKTRGVESANSSEQAISIAKTLSTQHNIVVAISGATDIIVRHNKTEKLSFGSPIMQSVTGMGCALTAVIAAFHAVEPDPFEAALLGTAYFGLCGEQAAQVSCAPGSFRTAFIDSLYALNWNNVKDRIC